MIKYHDEMFAVVIWEKGQGDVMAIHPLEQTAKLARDDYKALCRRTVCDVVRWVVRSAGNLSLV